MGESLRLVHLLGGAHRGRKGAMPTEEPTIRLGGTAPQHRAEETLALCTAVGWKRPAFWEMRRPRWKSDSLLLSVDLSILLCNFREN